MSKLLVPRRSLDDHIGALKAEGLFGFIEPAQVNRAEIDSEDVLQILCVLFFLALEFPFRPSDNEKRAAVRVMCCMGSIVGFGMLVQVDDLNGAQKAYRRVWDENVVRAQYSLLGVVLGEGRPATQKEVSAMNMVFDWLDEHPDKAQLFRKAYDTWKEMVE